MPRLIRHLPAALAAAFLPAAFAAAFLALTGATAPRAETPLALPQGSVEVFREVQEPGSYAMPVGRFTPAEQPVEVLEGRVLLRAWRLPENASATLPLMRALRPQLAEAGFTPVFDCAAAACGGFDFRVNTRLLQDPSLAFDLTDFRYLALRRPGPAPAHIALLASPGSLQAIEVTAVPPSRTPLAVPAPRPDPERIAAAPVPLPLDASDLATALSTRGRAVLAGVTFATGGQTLGPEQVAALAPVAELLTAKPEMAVVIVGHTDNAGSLAANIALSRARARAVRQALIDVHGIAPSRIEAEGVGFLLPRVPNTTAENRALNRRVEIILR